MKTIIIGASLLLLAYSVQAEHVRLIPPLESGKKAADTLVIKYKSLPGPSKDYLSKLNIQRQPRHGTLNLQAQITEKQKDPNILWVQPNQWRYALVDKIVPNDIYYRPERNSRQYNQWYLFMINANYAWSISKGNQDIIVAVVDTGIDLNHPDLKERLLAGITIINQEGYTPPPDGMDDNGHGTHVAGLIAASSNNETGICGSSWQGKLLPIKVLSDKGEGTDADISAGIIWAADQGAKIINLSLGGSNDDGSLPQVMQDAIDYASQKGCLIIAAAGNSGDDTLFYPAALNHVLSVAATNPWDKRAVYSTYNSYVDLAAPGGAGGDQFDLGTGMISTYWSINSEALDDLSGPEAGDYAVTAGTSMAAAVVSGAATVLWAHLPLGTALDIENTLKTSAVDIEASGADVFTGSGRIDLLAALGQAVPDLPNLALYNYPNPFNPDKDSQTQIVYFLDHATGLELKIADAARNVVWHKKIEKFKTMAGKNYLAWDGRNHYGHVVANGSYLVHLVTDDGQKSDIKFITVLR